MFGFFKTKSKPNNPNLPAFFKKNLGFLPVNWLVYEEALRHKSVARDKALPDNERLEFLGDAILDVIVAEYLYNNYAEAGEGELTQMKSRAVSRKNLGAVGSSLKLHEVIDFVDGPFVNKKTINGNALEAIIGAIYSDKGYKKCKSFIHFILQEHMDLKQVLEDNYDFKSQVLIWSQREKRQIRFVLSKEENFTHHKVYTFHIVEGETVLGSGEGRSKKKAEQMAALDAMKTIGI